MATNAFVPIPLRDDDPVVLPRAAVRFPVELHPPEGFRAEEPGTWPPAEGRLEYLGGRLLYMPPCGDVQQDVSVDVVGLLWTWVQQQPEYVVGGNEAGMKLGDDVRGAEAAVWRRDALGPHRGGYRRVPPILAVEVAGRDEGEPELREKARWYLDHGVQVVWVVLPDTREVLVLAPGTEARRGVGATLPPHADLPGLEPAVDGFFAQLDRK